MAVKRMRARIRTVTESQTWLFQVPDLGQALIQGQWEPRSECASDPSYVPRRLQHGNNIKASEPQDHKWPLTRA